MSTINGSHPSPARLSATTGGRSARRRGEADHVVVALMTGPLTALGLGVTSAVFAYDYGGLPSPWYDYRLASDRSPAEPFPLFGGFGVAAPYGLDALDDADTIVVLPTDERSEFPEATLDALRRAAARGTRLVSMCSGAFVLACAGLLDGHRVTTHWWYTDELARRFPQASVEPDVLFVDDGQILTSAGSAAGLDLCLHIVRTDHGSALANLVARAMVVPPHRDGGQAQYVDPPSRPDPVGLGLAEVMAWAVEHLDQDLRVEVLAERAALSPRTFARRFRQETGTSPHRWLTRQRIDRARHLLESSDRTVEEIAAEVGFGSAQSFRPRFKALVQVAPLEYRERFRCIPAA